MKSKYENNVKIIKALSDTNRLKIIKILSCGEMCACDILENLSITQPTLSHHMKMLTECGIVNSRKEGLWNYYTINKVNCDKLIDFLENLISYTDDCTCKEHKKCEC